MLKVFIDTNVVVHSGYDLARLDTLFARALEGEIGLYFPEVVVREIANKRREELEDRRRAADRALRKLETFDPASRSVQRALEALVATESVSASWEANFRREISIRGAEILDLPQTSHDRVLRRILSRRQPATHKSDSYRDILIWETVIAALDGEDPGALVSNDRSAFADDDATALATDLREDLAAEGLDEDAVSWHADVSALLSARPGLRSDAATRIASRLEDDEAFGASLLALAEGYMRSDEFMLAVELEGELIDYTRVEQVNEISDIQLEDAYATNGVTGARVRFDADCEVEFTMFSPSPWLVERFYPAARSDHAPQPISDTDSVLLSVEAGVGVDEQSGRWAEVTFMDAEVVEATFLDDEGVGS